MSIFAAVSPEVTELFWQKRQASLAQLARARDL